MAVALDVRRLHSVARSPVFATFAELVEGSATIRAAGLCGAAAAEVEAHVGVLQQAAITGAPTRQQATTALAPRPALAGCAHMPRSTPVRWRGRVSSGGVPAAGGAPATAPCCEPLPSVRTQLVLPIANRRSR